VIHYKNEEWKEASEYFETVLKLVETPINPSWEPTVYNLGHCYRKMGKFEKAIEKYQFALSISPNNYSLFSSIAFTFHIQQKFELAIDFYHRALSINSKDSFSSDMLKRAIEESFDYEEFTVPLPKQIY
jgi:anaphase-promoting complex subunit 6